MHEIGEDVDGEGDEIGVGTGFDLPGGAYFGRGVDLAVTDPGVKETVVGVFPPLRPVQQ
jgi:hypothetical protein